MFTFTIINYLLDTCIPHNGTPYKVGKTYFCASFTEQDGHNFLAEIQESGHAKEIRWQSETVWDYMTGEIINPPHVGNHTMDIHIHWTEID